jgi:site-specific DNA-methyltransferase (adenine-specific)
MFPMTLTELPLDQIINGDCITVLNSLPEKSIDLIFADPPYNLQLHQQLYRPNMTRVDAVNDDWDQFDNFAAYDAFCRDWLQACRRVLKDSGTIWVIGSYHNIFRIGTILQDLNYWILNSVIWVKTNPMPNFRGVRFTHAHEELIWASKEKGARYTFNHHAMKSLNDDLQMRSDWLLPICVGPERIKENGKKAHSTQKPEALLYRVILASSSPGAVVLDPFFGSGTTGAVAKKLHRHWIGIERDENYVRIAQQRIDGIQPGELDEALAARPAPKRARARLPFGSLLESGLLAPGQVLYFQKDKSKPATLKPDGRLKTAAFEGTIHTAGRHYMSGSPCNGWDSWYYEAPDGKLHVIDELRTHLLRAMDLQRNEVSGEIEQIQVGAKPLKDE